MIPDSEVLVGISALGLTLTGFSGLVAIMGRRSSGVWTEGERTQFIELAVLSLSVTFGAFVPILVSYEFSAATSLQLSVGIIAVVHLGCMIHGMAHVVRSADVRTAYARGVIPLLVSGGTLLIVASLVSALGLIGSQTLLILLNLLWMLFVAVVNFVQLLISSRYGDDA